ncbi:MAG: D-alanine--D-alanine ligase [Methylococcaceae bacterium]
MQVKSRSIQDPKEFGRVAVVMGGLSAERKISMNSGQAVLEALRNQGVDAIAVDTQEGFSTLFENSFDRVFNMIHGRGGEDGTIQGFLECLGLPYTGSDILASALSMDKIKTKLCWQSYQLPTPKWYLLFEEANVDECLEQLGMPVIIKPSLEGSSIGMSKATTKAELQFGWDEASQYNSPVYAEQWVTGKEYTVAILNDAALPVIRLETPHQFYDYAAKYEANTTQYHFPCGLTEKEEKDIQRLALKACHVIGVRGWGRVDVFIDQQQQAQLIEVNTVPGMTDHSLVPMAANAAGINFEELVWRILETSYERSI